jgi:hypothetical protein
MTMTMMTDERCRRRRREAALHENYHVGEIATLRKVLSKPRIG